MTIESFFDSGIKSDVQLSLDGLYRYWLVRVWDDSLPRVCWVMLNPSTADANTDDPTIRRCVGFAKRWGFGGIHVVNLFAYRATHPTALVFCDDPVGEQCDGAIAFAIVACTRIVAAWGVHGGLRGRDSEVFDIITQKQSRNIECLGITKHGNPKHPLCVSACVNPIPYTSKYLEMSND